MRAAVHWLTPEELRDRWNIPLSTIYAWRYKGGGPKAHKFGKHLRFLEEDVRAELEEHFRRVSSELPFHRRVKVLRFDDGRSLEPMCVLMHAVCHPCVFTWGDKLTPPFPNGFPKMSADFPGEAQTFVETVYGPKTRALFLQGCAGDIRPNGA